MFKHEKSRQQQCFAQHLALFSGFKFDVWKQANESNLLQEELTYFPWNAPISYEVINWYGYFNKLIQNQFP